MNEEEIVKLASRLALPFYQSASFWIGTVIGLLSIYFSVKAFTEAREAKKAASEAGKTVKIQTVKLLN